MDRKEIHKRFLALGETYAAGLFETPDRSLFYRKSLALRRYYETVPLMPYNGECLYPCGAIPQPYSVFPYYMLGLKTRMGELEKKDPELAAAFAGSEFFQYHSHVMPEHAVAGDMYTHSMPNYPRILREGLDSYGERISAMQDADLREGLTEVLTGLRTYRDRCLAYLCSAGAPAGLIASLEKVPFGPAGNIREAILSWNWILYLDNCDNMSALALGLTPYYAGEDVTEELRQLYRNLDINEGYSMQLGMAETPLTVQCLKASAGLRRPMIELFVDGDTTDEVWDAALDGILSGSGSPALYNRQLFHEGLLKRFPEIRETDIDCFCGGGCAESMIAGYSNCGSLDAGINQLLVLEESIREDLPSCGTFEEFYNAYLGRLHDVCIKVMEQVAASQKEKALYVPLPMRTLLIDDCIDRETEYNRGGARYMWSNINFAGTVNVIDSLLVIRDLIFREKSMTAGEMIRLLNCNDPAFLSACRKHSCRFGIDDRDANELGKRFTAEVFGYLRERKPYLGLGFLPASIQFRSYAHAGSRIGATPDGRASGEPLCDSLTAVFGKDTEGSTALLKSITSLDLRSALGTPIVNFTVNPKTDRRILRNLFEAYFALGGMQIQITCLSKEMLEEAYRDPDSHGNLIVRVGGYSEYFCRLDDALKQKVIERTFY